MFRLKREGCCALFSQRTLHLHAKLGPHVRWMTRHRKCRRSTVRAASLDDCAQLGTRARTGPTHISGHTPSEPRVNHAIVFLGAQSPLVAALAQCTPSSHWLQCSCNSRKSAGRNVLRDMRRELQRAASFKKPDYVMMIWM